MPLLVLDQVPGLAPVPAVLRVPLLASGLVLLRVLDRVLLLAPDLALALAQVLVTGLVQVLVPGLVRIPAQLLVLEQHFFKCRA